MAGEKSVAGDSEAKQGVVPRVLYRTCGGVAKTAEQTLRAERSQIGKAQAGVLGVAWKDAKKNPLGTQPRGFPGVLSGGAYAAALS